MRRFGLGLFVLAWKVMQAGPAVAALPWGQAAAEDLAAMHDIIRDNHPGPIDAANPGFRDWLDGGEAALLAQARKAASLHDYQTVLRDYANGFADGHLSVVMNDAEAHLWPGFLVRADSPDAQLRISALAEGGNAPQGVQAGMVLVSCGDIPARQLLEDHVLRPALNPHVPQRLRLASALLMVADRDDAGDQWKSCVVAANGASRRVILRWRPITDADLMRQKMRSSGIDVPQAGLKDLGGTWLISMPSFYPRDDVETRRLEDLTRDVTAKSDVLHAARHVVLDLRGNDGGDDAWGFDIAEALWGKAAIEAVEATLPTAVDWRVSARNMAALHDEAAALRRQGQTDGAGYFDGIADRMGRALHDHQRFMHEAADPARPVPKLASPFAHPVYLLTTPHCASACLDFVDLMDGLPGVVRIGLETSSDTDYLETAAAPLPSGRATLHYAMKVYRTRKRGANASYAPAIAWPGGVMDDRSIVRWVDTLN